MPESEWIVAREVVPLGDRVADGTSNARLRSGPSGGGDAPVCRDVRLADVRRRLREGAYDTRAAVEQVARRILASGDL